jgi:uncharacterized protein (DUF849 family)
VTSRIERLKACLNGERSRPEHAGVPVTPAELAEAAVAAVAAGAEAVHVHPRDDDGKQTLLAEHIGAAVSAIRRRCPSTAVGVSTGLWISGGEPATRLKAVSTWARLPVAARPDFASVNLSEPGFDELATVLRAAGIEAEAGVWSVSDADTVAAWRPPGGWLRILIEVFDAAAADAQTKDEAARAIAAADAQTKDEAARAIAAADRILRRLDEHGVSEPRLLHGEDSTCWPLIGHAGRLKLPTRVGLEDSLVGPEGEPVAGNADLVASALRMWDG